MTEKGITAHLEAFKSKGLGGVEIVPIYGERGDESNFIPYLSDRWINMALYTLREADRLGLGVDITLGSGWPYGGPWITEASAARKYDPDSETGVLTRQHVKRAAPGAEGLVFEMGDLRHMASAKLNDEIIGDFWCIPYRLMVPVSRIKSRNTLVLEVTNLDANRIIQMDRKRIPWKNFYEINFVDIRYRPFDASSWKCLPSGLLGPVRIIPVSLD